MTISLPEKGSLPRFMLEILMLFILLYCFIMLFIYITSRGNNYYCRWADEHLNFIRMLRSWLLKAVGQLLRLAGYQVTAKADLLLISGKGAIRINNNSLALGMTSLFSAFALVFPNKIGSRLLFLAICIVSVQFLNIGRLFIMVPLWKMHDGVIVDHDQMFTSLATGLISAGIWVRYGMVEEIKML